MHASISLDIVLNASGDWTLPVKGESTLSFGCWINDGNPMKTKKSPEDIARMMPVIRPRFLFMVWLSSSKL